jgi:hypothetical protein
MQIWRNVEITHLCDIKVSSGKQVDIRGVFGLVVVFAGIGRFGGVYRSDCWPAWFTLVSFCDYHGLAVVQEDLFSRCESRHSGSESLVYLGIEPFGIAGVFQPLESDYIRGYNPVRQVSKPVVTVSDTGDSAKHVYFVSVQRKNRFIGAW